MNNIFLDNIGSAVDLSSYSTSAGFSGFFEYKDSFSKIKVNKAIHIFMGFWEIACEDYVYIIHNLTLDESLENLVENYEYSSNDINEYIVPLINKGILYFENTIDNAKKENQFLRLRFCIKEAQDIYRMFFVVMALGGVDGHLFVVFENRSLILYPHDDCGFGVISKVKNNKWVEVFFSHVRKCDGFVCFQGPRGT